MSEMVERVAKAIRSIVLHSTMDPERDWNGIGHIAQQMYRREARAAIEAMQEPTEAMLHQGVGYTDFILPQAVGEGHNDYMTEMKCGWQAMIDEALR